MSIINQDLDLKKEIPNIIDCILTKSQKKQSTWEMKNSLPQIYSEVKDQFKKNRILLKDFYLAKKKTKEKQGYSEGMQR